MKNLIAKMYQFSQPVDVKPSTKAAKRKVVSEGVGDFVGGFERAAYRLPVFEKFRFTSRMSGTCDGYMYDERTDEEIAVTVEFDFASSARDSMSAPGNDASCEITSITLKSTGEEIPVETVSYDTDTLCGEIADAKSDNQHADESIDEAQIDEISGKTLGSYVQKARSDAKAKVAHGKELDAHPKVSAQAEKISAWYGDRKYDRQGRSVHRNRIDKAHAKISDIKKKLDPNYPDSTNASKRYRGIDKALNKMRSGTLTDSKITDEAVNHMGEREYQTWNGWKAACRKSFPGCGFRGDRDIASATLNGFAVGEWDGVVGCVFNSNSGFDFNTNEAVEVNEAGRYQQGLVQKLVAMGYDEYDAKNVLSYLIAGGEPLSKDHKLHQLCKDACSLMSPQRKVYSAEKSTTEGQDSGDKINEGVKFRVGDPKLAKVLRRFPHETQNVMIGADLPDELYDALFDYYSQNGEMPYGVMKGRTGDPYEWIMDRVQAELQGKITRYDVVEEDSHPDSEIEDIFAKYPHEAKNFQNEGMLDHNAFAEELYDYFSNSGEMPYGVMKARDGDPYQWIEERLHEMGFGETNEAAAADTMPLESIGDEMMHEDNEPSGIEAILAKYPEDVAALQRNEEPQGNLMFELHQYFSESGNMPYNIMTGDDGDPQEWILDTLSDWGYLDETLDEAPNDLATQTRLARLKAQDAEWAKAKDRVEQGRPKVNPFASDTRGRHGDELEWRSNRGSAFGEDSVNPTPEDGEEVITEINSEEKNRIVSTLTSSGFEEGLDYILDGDDIVAFGKGTSRVIRNLVGGHITQIDGEEVRISAQPRAQKAVPSRQEISKLAEPELSENTNVSLVADSDDELLATLRKLSGLPPSAQTMAPTSAVVTTVEPEIAESEVDTEFGMTFYRSIIDWKDACREAFPGCTFNGSRALCIARLDGHDVGEWKEGRGMVFNEEAMSNDDCFDDLEEAEYANEPDPQVHTSTSQMINQGDDMHRGKTSYSRASWRGDNPMSESRRLMKEYEAFKKTFAK